MKVLIAAVYTDFVTTIIDDDGIEQRDYFIAGPVSDKLILQFHRVLESDRQDAVVTTVEGVETRVDLRKR